MTLSGVYKSPYYAPLSPVYIQELSARDVQPQNIIWTAAQPPEGVSDTQHSNPHTCPMLQELQISEEFPN